MMYILFIYITYAFIHLYIYTYILYICNLRSGQQNCLRPLDHWSLQNTFSEHLKSASSAVPAGSFWIRAKSLPLGIPMETSSGLHNMTSYGGPTAGCHKLKPGLIPVVSKGSSKISVLWTSQQLARLRSALSLKLGPHQRESALSGLKVCL